MKQTRIIIYLIILLFWWTLYSLPSFWYRDSFTFPAPFFQFEGLLLWAYVEIVILQVLFQIISWVPYCIIASAWYGITNAAATILFYELLTKVLKLFRDDTAITIQFTVLPSLIITGLYCFSPFVLERIVMGQHHVVLGHLLLGVTVLYYIVVSNIDTENARSFYTKILPLFSLLSFVSIHHGIITFTLYAIYLLYLVFTQNRSLKLYIRRLIRLSIQIFVIIVLGFFRFGFSNNQLLQTYTNGNQYAIFKLMSWSNLDVYKLWINGSLGLSSWQSISFTEYVDNYSTIYPFGNLLFQYNLYIAFLILLAVLVTLTIILSNKLNLRRNIAFFSSIVVFFILSAGTNTPVYYILSKLPPFYIMRDSGKWYSGFLLLVLGVIVLNFDYLNSITKRMLTIIGVYFVASSLIFGFIWSWSLQPTNQSQLIEYANKFCSPDINMIYIPFKSYLSTGYTQLSISYNFDSVLSCNVITPQSFSVYDTDSLRGVPITMNVADEIIYESINKSIISNDAYEFINTISKQNIRLVVIDSQADQESYILYELLQKKLSRIGEFDSVYIFEL